ncbi:MAG: rplY1 [Clostridia bacterium]|jgi:large subunit ribosomal protein L25|nr:rplY1 [Clostridia bacterium]
MKSISLNANIREQSGNKQVRKLQKNHMIPAVLYSKNSQNKLLKLDYNEMNTAIEKNGEHIIVQLRLNNEEIPAIIKEVQRDPVDHKIVHIDFQPVSMHEVIHAEVPILVINGDRVEKNGWIINRQLGEVEVQGTVENIPRGITIDASKLKFGDVVKVADLEISQELSIISDREDIVISVKQFKEEPIDLIFPRTSPELIDDPKE